MRPLLFFPAPDWSHLGRLADAYAQTGAGRAELETAFARALESCAWLMDYILLVGSKPTPN